MPLGCDDGALELEGFGADEGAWVAWGVADEAGALGAGVGGALEAIGVAAVVGIGG